MGKGGGISLFFQLCEERGIGIDIDRLLMGVGDKRTFLARNFFDVLDLGVVDGQRGVVFALRIDRSEVRRMADDRFIERRIGLNDDMAAG